MRIGISGGFRTWPCGIRWSDRWFFRQPPCRYECRHATHNLEAYFRPTRIIREAAARVAAKAGVPATWLNDAVESYLSPRGDYDPYLELEHLRVFVTRPEYLLAMKCAAMRLGAEFHDLDDVRYLLRYLNVTTVDEALAIVLRYFDEEHTQPKTRLALEELLVERSG